ncbi:hypothetical protein PHYBLDRAFT_145026 [Phycomyces blakesleeanus NRRL 1555(-)]|uniref:Uncharacterized protein n=1 Tax=Phycomyces blakesleeanus (strain ATCC 8743b / DSM 1359 / FGSC 10004 / NBRC 33097 / NRRL 1555) TaxID=763407 RepID=A0A162UER8_PHYB8|nr:hypothetical protein PHYBLDRAFT_145026 [Phycomyces blakesleeanus NRRL 1555(-)]OAD74593.1 hypothetical protein PHYBLDRAFT_145026 [Phycomyces blakesleeanus NRRL 1555(-)]|eukprot:XP_018292633.1 hypothetical protein PHYBLDRAFT_145026 [Phycomyces blakesleeanus NRRL 1555(-)]
MENILLCKAGIQHCLGGRAAQRRLTDRRTSNFEVVSNNVASPQLWSNLIRKSLASIAIKCYMNYHNLVSLLTCLWDQNSTGMEQEIIEVVCITKMWKDNVMYRVRTSFDSRHVQANDLVVLKHPEEYGYVIKFFSHSVLGETRLFVVVDCLQDVWIYNELLFSVWESQTIGEMKVVEVKSIRGMAGLVHDINDTTIRHVVWTSPRHYQ